MNFDNGVNWVSIINTEEDHNMTLAKLDDFENCDNRNWMEFEV